MSRFNIDLDQEHLLTQYLDDVYLSKNLNFRRITDENLQHRGIDGIITYGNKTYKVDEKAQLHYLNKDLPTFTFELSYINKDNILKKGWLFDKTKHSDYYFLITGIILNPNTEALTSSGDIKHLKITSVNKRRLVEKLDKLNLNYKKLKEYDNLIRGADAFGKTEIEELHPKNEGLIYFTEHLVEKPMNLQLRLDWLIEAGIGKRI